MNYLFLKECLVKFQIVFSYIQNLLSCNFTTKINSDLYVIQYEIENVKYKMCVKRKKSPSIVIDFFDENMEKITKDVMPYLGSNEDFHNYNITPAFFRKKKIFIRTIHKDLVFLENDVMRLYI